MSLSQENIRSLFLDSYAWVKSNNYSSKDVCDVTSLPLYQDLQQVNYKYKLGKFVYAPFHRLYIHKPDFVRKISGLKPYSFPQAYALMAQGLIKFLKYRENVELHNDLRYILKQLESDHSGDPEFRAWGQPYNWFSRRKVPARTPRTTVTTQVAQAFLDAYEFYKEDKYLDIAKKAGEFMIQKMPWDKDADGDICFPYTTLDQYHVHNANVLAAALLARLGNILDNEEFKEKALRSFSFTAKHQNPDGSWFYWAPPDKLLGKIDHYHTGFVLESFMIGKNNWHEDFPFSEALNRGMNYYLENLFEDASIPKMLPSSKYPVDIQSCAQALITIGEVMAPSLEKDDWLQRICSWTVSNMFDEKNSYFYYRIYKSRVDATPYLRWGQSWMIRALTYLMK